MTEKKKIMISLILVSVVLVSGCVSSRHTTYNAGVVRHNNSLEEANNKCVELCQIFTTELKSKGELTKTARPEPHLNQCTETECECLC